MSVWGPGPFDNDDAADWLSELEDEREEETGAELLEDAVSEVAAPENVGYVEIPEGAMAVAAAELVALLLGKPGGDKDILDQETRASLSQEMERLDARRREQLVSQALTAVDRVLNDKENSELRQVLEGDEGMLSAWTSMMRDLHSRLRAIAGTLKPGGPARA